jgi:hypothetical protein
MPRPGVLLALQLAGDRLCRVAGLCVVQCHNCGATCDTFRPQKYPEIPDVVRYIINMDLSFGSSPGGTKDGMHNAE